MRRKQWKYTMPALILTCLMVVSSFVGSLNSTYLLSTENESKLAVREDIATPALDEIPLRMSADMVYDSESDRAIFFGGATENLQADYNDTWSYDYNTNTWTNMSPAIAPPACEWYQMAYHSGADRVILFGGHLFGSGHDWTNHNETWIYDYNTNTWTDMAPTIAPPAMAGGTMEYDSESDLVVLFGGWGDGGAYNTFSETWTYNLTSNTWTDVTISGQPSARTWATMTYDSESDIMVFFGGVEWVGYSTLSDTWTFDVDTNNWTEISTVGPNIVGDSVYDSESDRVVFYGGPADISELIEDLRSETWVYDTNTETWEMMVNEVKPPIRSRGELIYDSESDKIILFEGVLDGGWDTEEVLHDCWVYDLNNNLWNNVDWDWKEMTPINSPGDRCGSQLVYDIESDRMVIFSGWNNLHYDGVRYNDTWSYDYNTNTWTNMSPTVQPAGLGGHALAYSEKDDVVLMFGGSQGHQTYHDKYIAQTWVYDLNANTWTNMSPASNPNPSIFSSLTYDNESDVFVLFGGYMQDYSTGHETWIYNFTANTWTNVTTSFYPEGRFFGSMMDNPRDDTILLASGGNWGGFLNDVWSFNVTDNAWTEILATTNSPQFGLGMAFDLESGLLVGTGGPTNLDEDEFVSETWKFNLTSRQWNNSFSLHNPEPRSRVQVAYDIESDRTIMFGGALPDGTQGESLGDTWAYDYQINSPIETFGPPELEVSTDDSGLVLTWTPPDPVAGISIQGYIVYRGDESMEYESIAELGNVLTYTDKSAGFGIPYYYVVTAISENGEGAISNEETGSRPINPYNDDIFRFIVYGDTRAGDDSAVAAIHDDLVSHYLQYDPEMVIHSGDMVYHGGEAYQWPLFDASISAIADWDSEIEFFGAVGNHEWYTDVFGVNDEDFSNYIGHFDFSSVVDETGETELNYAFDREGIHFVILNTVNDWSGDTYTCPTAQMDWLESDLAEEHNFTIVITHYPSYSILADRTDRLDQAESLREEFQNVFTPENVDIVFGGHNHYYYRTVREGIYYITAAGGGAPLYETDTVETDWIEGDVRSSEYHYCVCSLVDGDLEIKVMTLDGSIADLMVFEGVVPIPTTQTNRSGTGDIFSLVLPIIIVGSVAIVIIVIVIIVKKKK